MSDPNEEGPGAPPQQPHGNNAGLSGGEDSADAQSSIDNPAGVTIEHVHNQCKELYTEKEQAQAWHRLAKTVEAHSLDEMLKRWVKAIDTYLVFAGLFSAILTAFNVPAYTLLNPPDPSNSLLQQISGKLDSFSISLPFINSTLPSSTGSANSDSEPPTLRWAVWLNGLWFSGLILSLTSAFMGLLSKQWLHEYNSDVPETSRHAARMRLYRLENIKVWHVEGIINTIPILLQLSLACFLAGLLLFLWNLHDSVATVASILVGMLAMFATIVTLLPLWKPRCAYLSPQIRALYHVWKPKQFIYWAYDALPTFFCAALPTFFCATLPTFFCTTLPTFLCDSLATFCCGMTDGSQPESTVDNQKTWQEQERTRIDELKADLDVKILCEAYRITLHPDTLSIVTVCLMSFDANATIGCFRLLHKSAQEHFGPTTDDHLGIWGQQQMLWLRVILCVSMASHDSSLPRDLLDDAQAAALAAYFESGSWPSNMKAADGVWAASTLRALTDHLQGEGTGKSIVPPVRLRMETKKLFDSAIGRNQPLLAVVQRVVSGAFSQVLQEQKRLAEASPNDAMPIDTSHLESAWHDFLEYANRALTSYTHTEDPKTIRECMRDVVAELTHALLELFVQGQVQTIITSMCLDGVMPKLCGLNDAHVEDCIPAELVPKILDLEEVLTATTGFYDNRWIVEIKDSVRALKAKITYVRCKLAATWAYDRVRFRRDHLVQPPSDEARAAHATYLQSVDYFLECADRASTSSTLSASDLETVQARIPGVLTHLILTLLDLFAQDQVRTTIKLAYLNDIMRKLRGLDDTRLGGCIPDGLVPDLLNLADKLATADLYYANDDRVEIQESACALKAKITHVKCKLAATWAYGRVRLWQDHLAQAPSDESMAAHTSYLQSVDYFLECANRATSTSSTLSTNDLETVRARIPVVLAELTHTLLELFAQDLVQTTIESTYLEDVMRQLSGLDDAQVEEYIPVELAPKILDLAEALTTATGFYDNRWIVEIKEAARTLLVSITRVKRKLASTWAYDRVRLWQKHVMQVSSDEARAAHTSYLQSVVYFLECADHPPTSSTFSADDLATVRARIPGVLTELTQRLLELFAQDQVRTIIESTYLEDVMRQLSGLDDAQVEECIPDELAPKILDLAKKLATTNHQADDKWVNSIQSSSRSLDENINRVKCSKPAAIWAYERVRFLQDHLAQAPSDEAKAAHTSYLQSVDYFLECADRALTSSTLSANDLNHVHFYMREVLADLTHRLLELFAQDQVRTTVKSAYLNDIMRKLRGLDDTRLGECISDELVPEMLNLVDKLATANHYAGDEWVNSIQSSARTLKADVTRVKRKLAATWAYGRVRLRQDHLAQAPSDEAMAAHTSYLQSVDYFLECADRASTSFTLSADDLESIRAHMREVLADLTHRLLELFAHDRMQTIIESTYLDDVMRKLRDLNDTRVGECIPGELVPEMLNLADILATANHYADEEWVNSIQSSARILRANITRVRRKLAATWAYDRVRLQQNHLAQAPSSSDSARAAHTSYLQSVDDFLECAGRASISSSLSADDLEIVRVHMREVTADLTHRLLELFAHDRMTIIESTYLDDVMRKLRDLDDVRVRECIPDELVPDISDLAEKLATAAGYHDDSWVDVIQSSARTLREKIDRVKCGKPAATWAYGRVRLRRDHLSQAPSVEARAARADYLQSVNYFLECIDRVSTSSTLSDNDLEAVRAHTQSVLAELTRTLLELLQDDQLRTTIQSTDLDDVMRKLRDLDDTRLGECISDEVVPEILNLADELTTTDHYADDEWVNNIQSSARRLHGNIYRVKCGKPATTWAYDRVCLLQDHLAQAPSDESMAAHTSYLQNVNDFLECANHDLTSSFPANELEIVRAHIRDVLTQLTHTLLGLFAKDRTRTTIQSTYLDDVMRKLRNFDDARVQECIPDELVPDISDLAEKLATAAGYHDNNWVNNIQNSARTLKEKIDRVKCGKPGTVISLETILARLRTRSQARRTEPVISPGPTTFRSLDQTVQVNASPGAAAHIPGGDSQDDSESTVSSDDALM